MSYKTDRRFYASLLKIFIVLAFFGVAALLYAQFTSDTEGLVFSVVAFLISVAALIMTTLQSIAISRQMRITESSIQLVREADRQIEELVDEDKKLSAEIRKDIALDQQIVRVLEEVGVGDNDEERRVVAERIAKRIDKSAL